MAPRPARAGHRPRKGDEMRTRALVAAAVVGSLALATSALAAIVEGTPGDEDRKSTRLNSSHI